MPFDLIIRMATPASTEHIHRIVNENYDRLHPGDISVSEWQSFLTANDPDEAHYIVYTGDIPAAWLKINGLLDGRTGWISMLAVAREFHRRGVGTFAIRFAEELFRNKGFTQVGIHTTEDNLPAKTLYLKLGYPITEYGACTTGDGVDRMGYTFLKDL